MTAEEAGSSVDRSLHDQWLAGCLSGSTTEAWTASVGSSIREVSGLSALDSRTHHTRQTMLTCGGGEKNKTMTSEA